MTAFDPRSKEHAEALAAALGCRLFTYEMPRDPETGRQSLRYNLSVSSMMVGFAHGSVDADYGERALYDAAVNDLLSSVIDSRLTKARHAAKVDSEYWANLKKKR